MAKRRSIAELRRALKRRLLTANQGDIEKTARDIRSFAIACAFFDGYSTSSIVLYNALAKPFDQGDVENAIRNHGARRR